MSGIFGIWNKCGAAVNRETLKAMQDAMAFWGRDARGIWCDGPVALGQLLMQDTPESIQERQPYTDPRWPHLSITADARIDNRDELYDALGIRSEHRMPEFACDEAPDESPQEPHSVLLVADPRSRIPDGALVLCAYERWGTECVERLLGAFAFVIWDGRRRELFCARDHIGFRPFYYYKTDRRFIFASDVTALLSVPGMPRRIDDQAVLSHHLLDFRTLKERSFFVDIHKLPPAYWMVVKSKSVMMQCWWRPTVDEEIRLSNNDDYATALREQLDQAVVCRLRTHHAIGSHLSSGLDSSAVTVLAARRLRDDGHSLRKTYSWSPPLTEIGETRNDERQTIQLVCDQERLQCEFTELSLDDVMANVTRDFTTAPTTTMLYEQVVCRRAAGQNVRVLLSGWGGDEFAAFNGRGFFAEMALRGNWLKLLRESRRRAQIHGGVVWKDIVTRVVMPLLPNWCYALTGRDISPLARKLVNERGIDYDDFGWGAERMLRAQWRATRERPGTRRVQLALLDNGHLTYRLEAWAHLAAQHGMTHRYPLLDRRMIQFSLSLPSDMYFQQGWKRFLFRYAAKDVLPDSVRWNKNKHEPAWTERHRGMLNLTQDRIDVIGECAEFPPWIADAIRLRSLLAGSFQT